VCVCNVGAPRYECKSSLYHNELQLHCMWKRKRQNANFAWIRCVIASKGQGLRGTVIRKFRVSLLPGILKKTGKIWKKANGESPLTGIWCRTCNIRKLHRFIAQFWCGSRNKKTLIAKSCCRPLKYRLNKGFICQVSSFVQ